VLLFDASDSRDNDGSIVNYSWDFGDGKTGTGMITTHTYELKGDYAVILTVTDNDGLTDDTTRTIDDLIPEYASIPKPFVPEFTLKFVDNSYDVPTTYKIDPFTGENVTDQEGYHVENKSVEVWIKNQPFTPVRDEDGDLILDLYYNIRRKGHFDDRWREPLSSDYVYRSDSDYTVVSYTLGSYSLNVTSGGQIDFQVEALVGDYVQVHGESVTPWGASSWNVFLGETSGWSNTQTITVDADEPAIAPDEPTEPDKPTTPDEQITSGEPTPDEESNQPDQSAIILAIAVTATVAALGSGLLVYLKMRKH
jgi:hypothetical protein